jgi:hypothetical protein
MSMLQLNPPIPVWTEKGTGQAWLVVDYGAEHHLMWTVAMDYSGEVWTFSNPEIRAQWNVTLGRTLKEYDNDRQQESARQPSGRDRPGKNAKR